MKKMKLFVSLLSAAVMASTTILGASAAHYKGDIDRNDSVTASDVVTIQKHLSGKKSIAKDKLIYADMNDDGKINVFDLVVAKRVALGKAPAEEVPSLTTPVVTTTTPVTSTTISTTISTTTTPATTEATTTTTTEVTTTTTEATTTTTTEVTTTSEETTTTTTEATTTSEETTTTTTEVTTTSEETTTTTTEITTTPEETTTTTTEVTTTSEETTTTTTEVTTEETTTETTTTEPKETTAGTTYTMTIENSKSLTLEFDSTKEIDYIEFEFDTSEDFNFHMYLDNWTTYFNIHNTKGTLTYSNTKDNIEAITIDGNKVKVEFKEGVSGQTGNLISNYGKIKATITAIAYVGDETPEPAETTTTTATEAETTATTVATTVTETETTVSEEITTTVSDETETVQTGVAGTDVNRAMLGFAYSDADNDYVAINGDASYVGLESKVLVPEISGDGTYTARFTFDKVAKLYEQWIELTLYGANGKNISIDNYPELKLSIDGFKVNGVETTKLLDSAVITIGNWNPTKVNLVPLFETFEGITSFEVTFTITGLE